jgi:hypothetical protein
MAAPARSRRPAGTTTGLEDDDDFTDTLTTPQPPSTFAAVPLAGLPAATVPGLDGWTVASIDAHVGYVDGDETVDVFAVDATDAAVALDWFYERAGRATSDVRNPAPVRLGAPGSRFLTVLDSQFVATDAEQLATTTISGSVIAAARRDGSAVVIAISRPGTSSTEELAADGVLPRAILAHL